MLERSIGTTNSSNIGHTYIFWIGTKVTGHTMDITRKIQIHHIVNPWASVASQIVQTTPATHPKWKLVNYVFQTEDSRFWWQIPHWTCCTRIYMAATMLNLLYRHISNPLYFYHRKFIYMINYPVPILHLSRVCQWSIHTEFHDFNYLLLRHSLALYMLTKT